MIYKGLGFCLYVIRIIFDNWTGGAKFIVYRQNSSWWKKKLTTARSNWGLGRTSSANVYRKGSWTAVKEYCWPSPLPSSWLQTEYMQSMMCFLVYICTDIHRWKGRGEQKHTERHNCYFITQGEKDGKIFSCWLMTTRLERMLCIFSYPTILSKQKKMLERNYV